MRKRKSPLANLRLYLINVKFFKENGAGEENINMKKPVKGIHIKERSDPARLAAMIYL